MKGLGVGLDVSGFGTLTFDFEPNPRIGERRLMWAEIDI
jgi:hypothetical protein